MSAKSMWNCEIALNSQILLSQFCRIQFFTCSPWSLCWEEVHCIRQLIWEQSFLSHSRCSRYTLTLNSCEARRAALVLRFAAGRPPPHPSKTCRRPVPPSASLAALRNRTERKAVRHWQKGTQVLSVTRSRALATVASCGISICLP